MQTYTNNQRRDIMYVENPLDIQTIDGNEQLYQMCKELWSNMSVEEFEETLKEEGWDELYTRCMITRETYKYFRRWNKIIELIIYKNFKKTFYKPEKT